MSKKPTRQELLAAIQKLDETFKRRQLCLEYKAPADILQNFIVEAEEIVRKVLGTPMPRPKSEGAEERRKAYLTAWHKNNPEKSRAATKRWREKNVEQAKASARKSTRKANMKKYGVTEAEYNAALELQNHHCAICGCDKPENREWSIDHCHLTNRFRGVLCPQCNTALGLVQDNVEILAAMIRYLER